MIDNYLHFKLVQTSHEIFVVDVDYKIDQVKLLLFEMAVTNWINTVRKSLSEQPRRQEQNQSSFADENATFQ